MDDIRLRTLLAAVRLGSFSKAAAELHTTQSAISQTMRRLEDELGCQLLARTHAGVALTDEGRALLPALLAADAALARVKEEAAALRRGQEPPIAIGAFSSISNTCLPRFLKGYQTAHPRVRYRIFIGTDILSEWLLAGKIDIALGDETRLGNFMFTPLADDRYFAVVPRGSIPEEKSTLTQDELAHLPLFMAPRNALGEHLEAQADSQTIIDCDDDSTLLSMAAAGLGATAMPALSLKSLHPLPESVRILPLVPETKRVLGYATRKEIAPQMQAFGAYLKEVWG
ncbi:MAG: LysR family transcriptional regulator [Veillonellaceae bacterium]|nr:LysR family transcriptional regulator [Veillonellaceae bacterium]